MGRAVVGFWRSPTAEGTPALVVTTAFFALGGLIGCFSALRTGDLGAEAMAAYLDRFLAAAQSGSLEGPAFAELLWRSLRWPVGAFLLGFTALGLFGVPALCSFRGFFLAFSIASFARSYGRRGLLLALLLLGVPGVVAVPAFLLLSARSFLTARVLASRVSGQGKRELPYGREDLFRCGRCAVAVCVGLLIECYLVPALLAGAAGSLLG